jgi:hypothetical protein
MIYVLMVAFVWCIVNAEIDRYIIEVKKKVPNHAANAGFYLGFVIVACFFTDWRLALPLLCLRPLVFDNYLNLRRIDKGLTYQPKKPDSVVDRIENAIFGHRNAWTLSNLVYLIGFIAGIIIYQKDL